MVEHYGVDTNEDNQENDCHQFKDRTKWVEQKCGRWEQHKGISICTRCHSMFDVDLKMIQVPSTFEMPIHCPNCGAKNGDGNG